MEDNQVIDVRVVSTETDYVEQIKVAAVTSVVGVIVTAATMALISGVAASIKSRRETKRIEADLKLAKETEQDS